MTSHQLDLRALIHEVAAESGPDLEVVTKEVRRRIPDNAVEDALDQALPTLVYKVARTGGVPSQEVPEPQEINARGAARKPVRSSKVAALRSYPWERHLREWVSVGKDEFKFFGDCTADDLSYAAEVRFQLAEANRAHGERMMTARELLVEHGVSTVRELPPDTLGEFFGSAA